MNSRTDCGNQRQMKYKPTVNKGSNRPQMLFKIGILKTFATFTGKKRLELFL